MSFALLQTIAAIISQRQLFLARPFALPSPGSSAYPTTSQSQIGIFSHYFPGVTMTRLVILAKLSGIDDMIMLSHYN